MSEKLPLNTNTETNIKRSVTNETTDNKFSLAADGFFAIQKFLLYSFIQ